MSKVTVIRPGKDAEAAKKAQTEFEGSFGPTMVLVLIFSVLTGTISTVIAKVSGGAAIVAVLVGMALVVAIHQTCYAIPARRYKKYVDDKTIIEVSDPQILALVNSAWGVRDELVRRYETGLYEDVLRLTQLQRADGETGVPDLSSEVAELVRVRSTLLHDNQASSS